MTIITKSESLTRPIIGIENRTAQEAFNIMCDRICSFIEAQTEGVQEPVAWLMQWPDGGVCCLTLNRDYVASSGEIGLTDVPLFRAIPPQSVTVPAGWRLVPEEPTQAMLKPWGPKESYLHRNCYRAMLSASPPAPQHGESAAARDVLAERRRQIEVEGWMAEHDDQHSNGEMLTAALCYLQRHDDARMFGYEVNGLGAPARWPWALEWYRPKNIRRDLVRSAALIVAEIDRLDRLAKASSHD